MADYLIGAAKRDVTAFVKGIGMLGWAESWNTVESVESNLYARVFVIKDPETGHKVAYVNAEIAFFTIALWQGILAKLQEEHPETGFNMNNVMLSAQHTHSAPGGYTHYILYNMTIPGFSPTVYWTIVNGVVDAILEADRNAVPATIHLDTGTFPLDQKVAFNRSPEAYSANPETENFGWDNRHEAVDREMTMLRFEALDGTPIGAINWFAVHCTTVHDDKKTISSDNKGFAAIEMEKQFAAKGYDKFVSAFSQSAAGDITPNFMVHKGNWRMSGPSTDDYENVRFNGGLQLDKANEIFDKAKDKPALKLGIDTMTLYYDLSKVQIDPEFCMNLKDQRTGPARHGLAFFGGTAEGGGLPDAVLWILDKYIRMRGGMEPTIQGNKVFAVEGDVPKFLSHKNFRNIVKALPSFVSPEIKEAKRVFVGTDLGPEPLTPHVLPVQIFTIGELAILSLPVEPTTFAGERIRRSVEPILRDKGIKKIIIGGYANAYAGYMTTYEEYQLQRYEGGHTLFGKWTGAAFQTIFKEMATEMTKKPSDRTLTSKVTPYKFTEKDLNFRLCLLDPLVKQPA